MSAHAIGNRDRRARGQFVWLYEQHRLLALVVVECQRREWLILSLFGWLLVRCRGHLTRLMVNLQAIMMRKELK